MVCGKSFNRFSLLPKVFVQTVGLGNISQLVDNIVFMFDGGLVSNWIAVEELERSGHISKIVARSMTLGASAVIVPCCALW